MSNESMKSLLVDIDLLTPHPRNVRQGDVGAICESLKAHGQYRAIVFQKSSNQIIAGNHTWKAAKSLGLNVAGVDIVRSSHGPLVLEVNSSPGLEGIEKVTGKDIAGAIIEYIEKFAIKSVKKRSRQKV